MKIFFVQPLFALFIFSVLVYADDSWMLYDDTEVDVVEITIDPEDLDWIYDNVESDSLHPAVVHYSNEWFDETIDSVGFRLRGNTARTSAKKSFKLDFNHFVPGRDFYGMEKINLNGEHNDPSIIRSKLCWDLFHDIGVISSRATHIAVYINGDYYGLYISVEHVDDEFLAKNYADDNGNLWKCLWPADLTYRGDDSADYHPYYDEERPYNLKTNEDEYDYSQLARLIKIVNQTPDETFPDSLEAVFHVEEVLKYFAMNVLVGGWDDYWFLMNNYYLYHEPNEDRFHWIPFDYDNSFGVDWFSIDWTATNPYEFPIIDGGPRPLAERLMDNNQYRDLYSHFLQYFLENVYPLSFWENHIDTLYSLIYPWAEIDVYRTFDYGFTLDDFTQSYSSEHYENQHVKRGIREFVNLRVNSFTGVLQYTGAPPIVYDIAWEPKNPQPEDSIHVTISAFGSNGVENVIIHYYDAPIPDYTEYPMEFNPVPNTKLVEESDRWTGMIPPLGSGMTGYFEIYVEDGNGQGAVFPRHEKITLQTPGLPTDELVINEFLAKNDETNMDEAGEYDDWIEIYNTSGEDIDLSGMYLTDKSDNLTKWQFPYGGVMLEAGGYLLVWCDEDQEQGDLHTNFKLTTEGEFIALTAEDGVTITDSITFGQQSADVSFGRMPDGSDQWMFLDEPSPGVANSTGDLITIQVENISDWNLIGLPLEIENASYSNLFPESIEGTLYSFDNTYIPDSILILGYGYWLKFNNVGSTVLTGIPINELTISLSEGWNLISGISISVDINTIIDVNDLIVFGTIYGFNGTYVSAEMIDPGVGYWLRSYEDGEITISSNSILSAKITRETITLLEHANTLTLNNQTLYFGVEIPEDEKLRYSLPPKPPAGAFDVRFSGNWKYCGNDGVIEIMNPHKTLEIQYDIHNNEKWEIIPVIANGTKWSATIPMNGKKKITLDSDIEKLILRKSQLTAIPQNFALHPAYPNPFNPSTTISFDIPDATDRNTSLHIYDITGKLVETLVNGTVPVGTHTITWNPKNLSAGLYIVQLKAGNKTFNQKLTFLK